MDPNLHQTFQCPVCQQDKPVSHGMPGELINSPLADLLGQQSPDWNPRQMACLGCLERTRADYIQQSMKAQEDELSSLEEEMSQSAQEHKQLVRRLSQNFRPELRTGERIADHASRFFGSWSFVLGFLCVTAIWLIFNSAILKTPPDPWPYSIINLAVTMLAVIQAPIIIMAQNRIMAQERRMSRYEAQVNLKAELEIRQLHAKLDRLLTTQWQRLLEIQQVQTELMEHIAQKTVDPDPKRPAHSIR